MEPIVTPVMRASMKKRMGKETPTAASAVVPRKRPTTKLSTIL